MEFLFMATTIGWIDSLVTFATLETSSTYPEKKFVGFFVFENAEGLTQLNEELLSFFMIIE